MKRFVPRTNVAAESGNVQDLINAMRGDLNDATLETTRDESNVNEKDISSEPKKKAIVPQSVVAVDPEIEKLRRILTSREDAVISSDGTISAADSVSTNKAKTVPKSVVAV